MDILLRPVAEFLREHLPQAATPPRTAADRWMNTLSALYGSGSSRRPQFDPPSILIDMRAALEYLPEGDRAQGRVLYDAFREILAPKPRSAAHLGRYARSRRDLFDSVGLLVAQVEQNRLEQAEVILARIMENLFLQDTDHTTECFLSRADREALNTRIQALPESFRDEHFTEMRRWRRLHESFLARGGC